MLAAPTERGERTRRALINAALELMAEGRSFNSLGIREITHQAGVSPTAFYRHFDAMDELGLMMVEDCSRALRHMLREIRRNSLPSNDIIRDSFLTFMRYADENPKYFLVCSGERHGGSPIIRDAVRREIELFAYEMAEDIKTLDVFPNLSFTTLLNISNMVIDTSLSAASELLDLRAEKPQLRVQKFDAYVQRLLVLFLGAGQWHDAPVKSRGKPKPR